MASSRSSSPSVASDFEIDDEFGQTTPFSRSQDGYPRTLSLAEESLAVSGSKPLQLTFLHGLAIVVSLQIGSGIFSAPTQVSQHVPSPGIALVAWLVGGLLVWTGASSFIELGLAVVRNGGMQEYLRACYGDFMGFLFTLVWVAIAKPSSIAIISTVFSDHICRAFLPSAWTSLWTTKAVALLGLFLITFLNCLGAKTGPNLANGFLAMKLTTVVSIVITGLIALATGRSEGVAQSKYGWFGVRPDDAETAILIHVGNFVTAMFGALYCYGGWETIGFILGDMANPQRDLPRILNGSMVIVLVSFLLMNTTLYLCLPFDLMRTNSTVVVEFGNQVFGFAGAVIYSLLISASALGSMNSNMFATAALCVAASQRGYFPKMIANLHCQSPEAETALYRDSLRRYPNWARNLVFSCVRGTQALRWEKSVPIYAMVLTALLASCYVVIGTFNGLVTFVVLAEYFFMFLSVLGIFVLRSRAQETGTSSPSYRTWTGNPIIFCVVSAFILLQGTSSDLLQGVTILAMIPVAWILFRFKDRGET